MIDVVTTWTPRPSNPKWRDYMHLLALQARSVHRAGHRHVIMTDAKDCSYLTAASPRAIIFQAETRESLMFAILEAQIAYLLQRAKVGGEDPFVMVDIDCIVVSRLEKVFTTYADGGQFDVLLTSRRSEVSPIQNGAMYFNRGSEEIALRFLRRALELCQDHWGGDQEAISKAVAPVPMGFGSASRFGGRFQFESTDRLNHSAKDQIAHYKHYRHIEHFKGNLKRFADAYCEDLFKRPIV